MKFLIAASLMCFALVGQTQGGSLRGYTYSVPVPHETYGVPLEVSQPIVEDVPTIAVEQPAVESSVVPGIQNIPLVDSLPFVDSAANFVIPSEPQPPAVAPQPELPYLEPGLPTLPERPVVPVLVEEPLPVVQNTYLPPVREVSSTTVTEASYPSDVAPDAEVIETAAIPTAPASEVPALPQISEIPALPAAPVTPSTPVAPQPSETYGPPAVHVYEVLQLPVHATVAPEPSAVYGAPTEAPAAPKISEIPALPAAPVIPTVQVYEVPAAPVTPYVPVTATPTPSSVYGPPAAGNEVPAVPQIAEIPALPAAPVTPSVLVQLYEVPAAPETPQATGIPSSVYGPPAVVKELPPAPQIAEIPALPATPFIPSVQVYEVPAAPETPQATGIPSSVYGPPTVVKELPPAPQITEIPALPAAPAIPAVQVYDVPAAPVVLVSSGYAPQAPTVSTQTFGIRPIVSQIINFASSFLPVGEGSYTDSVAVEVPAVVAAPAEVPIKAGYTYEKPTQAFPTPGSAGYVSATSELDAASVSAKVPEAVAVPAEIPIKSGYDYKKPVKGFPTPVSVGVVSQVQNTASSLSSSSLHVNHVVLPSFVQPSGSFAEQVQPSGSGYTIQSVSENAAQTSAGSFNQVAFIQHGLPQVGVPHNVFAVPSF